MIGSVWQRIVPPLQGWAFAQLIPRALPWAGLECPFGAPNADVFSELVPKEGLRTRSSCFGAPNVDVFSESTKLAWTNIHANGSWLSDWTRSIHMDSRGANVRGIASRTQGASERVGALRNQRSRRRPVRGSNFCGWCKLTHPTFGFVIMIRLGYCGA